jgi:signal transduction histidine kinase
MGYAISGVHHLSHARSEGPTDSRLPRKPEYLTRIFTQGFTTRKGGHGFGLHSSALAAKIMGGSLSVSSHGEGQGATFTLELPAISVEAHV